MKKILILLLIAAAYVFGRYGSAGFNLSVGAHDKTRKIVYYVDPMHPWYKSDRPGVAPDCNMELVPVYPGEEAQYQQRASGVVQVTPHQKAKKTAQVRLWADINELLRRFAGVRFYRLTAKLRPIGLSRDVRCCDDSATTRAADRVLRSPRTSQPSWPSGCNGLSGATN